MIVSPKIVNVFETNSLNFKLPVPDILRCWFVKIWTSFSRDTSNSTHAHQAPCNEVITSYLTYIDPYREGTVFAIYSLQSKILIYIL